MKIFKLANPSPSSISMKNLLNPIQSMKASLVKPRALKKGDTIGIFTPSWPAHVNLRNKYLHALEQIQKAGFNYYEGHLTKNLKSNGYRSADPQARAEEFMELISEPKVNCLMATIGGWNSSSLIPYLDFNEIRKQRKIICGYSDITALQMAVLKHSELVTIYGPSLVPVFGEFPQILPYAMDSFLNITSGALKEKTKLQPPQHYSNQFIDATAPDWKQFETKREYNKNEGWSILSEGRSTGQLIVANLETLLSLAGTPVFPDLKDKILVIEEEEARLNIQERAFTQLLLMGAFDNICGLIISKPFSLIQEDASFSYNELIHQIIGKRHYPIITDFDCGHTFPSLTLPIGTSATLSAFKDSGVEFYLEENPVEN